MQTILIVDDNREDAEFVAGLARARGFQVRFVGDGIRALVAIRGGGLAGVVRDNRMPGMDGIDVLGELSVAHADLTLPPIAMYAGGDGAQKTATGRGAVRYIQKSDPGELEAFLDGLVRPE